MSTIAQDAVALKTKTEAHFAGAPSAEANSAIALLEQLVHITQYITEDVPAEDNSAQAESEAAKAQAEEDAKSSAAAEQEQAAAQAQAEAEAVAQSGPAQ
jgi:hypothetical protein